MKRIILLVLITSMIIGSCAKQEQESEFPQGAWQLVQVVRITDGLPDVRFPRADYTGSTIKMWTEQHWMFVGIRNRADTAMVDLYGGGTYTLEGTQYEEDIIYHNAKLWVGRVNETMTMELRNDTMFQSYHPLDSIGNQLGNVTNVEKYIRLD